MEERLGHWGMRISSSFSILLLLLLLLVTKYDKLQANKRTNLSQRVVYSRVFQPRADIVFTSCEPWLGRHIKMELDYLLHYTIFS